MSAKSCSTCWYSSPGYSVCHQGAPTNSSVEKPVTRVTQGSINVVVQSGVIPQTKAEVCSTTRLVCSFPCRRASSFCFRSVMSRTEVHSYSVPLDSKKLAFISVGKRWPSLACSCDSNVSVPFSLMSVQKSGQASCGKLGSISCTVIVSKLSRE